MKKKIMSILLTVSLICSYALSATAEGKYANTSEIIRAKINMAEAELATKILSKLEIMEYSANNENDIISRIDFAVYFGRLLGVDEYAQADVTYFNDVPDDHYALSCVNYLTQKGAFNGNGNSEFRPNDPISPIDVAKVIFNAIGYGAYAEMTGGYPTAYQKLASKSKLLDGFDGVTNLTRSELFVLLFRAGFINMPENALLSGDMMVYDVESGESTFGNIWNIYDKYGVVTAAGVITIDESAYTSENKIVIGGKTYDENEQKSDMYLGRYVRAIVVESDNEDRLLWMVVDKNKTDETVIKAEDVIRYNNGSLSYYDENGRERSKGIDAKAAIILNGKEVEYLNNGIFNFDKGEIYLIDTTRDNMADTVIINNYKSYIVGYVDTSRDIIYDKISGKEIVNLDKYDSLHFYFSSGTEATLSDIGTDSIISIKESKDYIEIYISTESVTGIISSVTEKNDKLYLTIDGVDYNFDKEFLKDKKWFPDGKFLGRTGESYKLNLDMFSDIVYIDAVSSSDVQAGYIIQCIYNKDGFDDKVLLKLLNQEGEIITPQLNTTVRIDGTPIKGAQKIYDAIMKGDGEFILYMVNGDGAIKYIDTTYRGEKESEGTLKKIAEKEKQNVKGENKSYGPLIMPSSSIKRFIVPAENKENANYKKFSVATGFGYGEDANITVAGYVSNSAHVMTDFAVIYEGANDVPKFSTIRFTVVNEISQVVNSDGDVVYQIDGVLDGNEVTYTFTEDIIDKFVNLANDKVFTSISELEPGDMLQLAVNDYGEAYAAQLVFDYSDGVESIPVWGPYMPKDQYGNHNGMVDTFVRCYVNRIDSGYGEVILDKSKPEEILSVSNFNGKSITVVDTSGEVPVARPGSVADIQQASVSKNVLPMYIFMWRYSARSVIIFK